MTTPNEAMEHRSRRGAQHPEVHNPVVARLPEHRPDLTLVALDADEMVALRAFWDARDRARRLFGSAH